MSKTYEEELLESEDFQMGVHIGKSIGAHEHYQEAVRAYELGEIDLWIEYHRPKTWEEWEAWNEEHGEDFDERWQVE